MRKADIGNALDSLSDDVRAHMRNLVAQFRAYSKEHFAPAVLKAAIDTPKRAQAQVQGWMATYDAKNGAGSAQTLLVSCLSAAGASKTLAQVNTDLAALIAQAQTLVAHVQNDGWTWEQVADAIDAQFVPTAAPDFVYSQLPVPSNYVTVWGEQW